MNRGELRLGESLWAFVGERRGSPPTLIIGTVRRDGVAENFPLVSGARADMEHLRPVAQQRRDAGYRVWLREYTRAFDYAMDGGLPHVPADEESLWVWMTKRQDGACDICAGLQEGKTFPMISRQAEIAFAFYEAARAYMQRYDQMVWLRRFTGPVDREELQPSPPSPLAQ